MTTADYRVHDFRHYPPCILLGLAGRSGSGKDTAAQHLVQHYGFVQVAFADPLRDALEAWLDERGVDYAHLHEPQLKSNPIPACKGRSARVLMQSLGDWGRSVDPHWWVDQLAHRIGLADPRDPRPVHDRFVVSDVRYPDEAGWLRHLGGQVIRLHRTHADHAARQQRARHSSEAGLHSSWVDHELSNDDSKLALADALDSLMHRLQVSRQPEGYRDLPRPQAWRPVAPAASRLAWPRLLDDGTDA